MAHSRREFLSAGFSVCSAFGVSAALTSLSGRLACGGSPKVGNSLVPTIDETTGLPLLRLPEGFRYLSFGWTRDLMKGGVATPAAHDGMGVVAVDGDVLTLVRNHEVGSDGPALSRLGEAAAFDSQAQGGCTTLVFDSKQGKLLDSWVSFAGTSRNCAGGITPWGTWLTCEETVLGPGDIDRYKKDVVRGFKQEHGWIFEVHPDGSSQPIPLKSMGRFVHEAVCIDHNTGIVYETEDRTTSAFYRFVPQKNGQLAAGGTLEVAEVVGQPDLRGGVAAGAEFDVRWHQISDPEKAHSSNKGLPDELGVYKQAAKLGATTFARLEGCWFGNEYVYFDATSGGQAKAGQIWKYDPVTEKLTLLFESPAKQVLNMPDNLCVSPQGGLVLCEDNNYGVTEFPQRIFALSQEGNLKLLAENNVELRGEKNGFKGDFRNKEWAGASFSPDGVWMFANIQTPGITFAITGPWDSVM
ncbi:MAG: alkaline phosphatase PhoX [Fuerstiella sp.]